MTNEIALKIVSRADVSRIQTWLQDHDVSESWFGRYSYGNPAHLGYHPEEMENLSEEDWGEIFNDPEHIILSIYTNEEHVGEIHIAIEESLGDGQLSILIGRKDLWHHGLGTTAVKAMLKRAFTEYGLFRVWVDIPEYNDAARNMFSHMGFVHEGTLRKSRPHEGARFDSVILGILRTEYDRL